MAAAAADGGNTQIRRHHGRRPQPPSQFHLLEFTVISAQSLYPATLSRMRTYASVWIDSEHPLSTKVDRSGHTNPTWNDKFVFRVGDDFLRSETSAIAVRLYAARGPLSLLPDRPIGEVRVIVSALGDLQPGHRRFVALMVRRPSTLQPFGILNLGVALLDPCVWNMSLYYDLGASSALAYKDLVGARKKIREDPAASAAGMQHGMSGDKEHGNLDQSKESSEFRKSMGERERKELLSKIEMWKAEITPERDMAGNAGRSKKKKSWMSCCFCGGSVIE